MNTVAEHGRIPEVSTRFSLSMEMSSVTRDGIAEPVSRSETKFSGVNANRKYSFPIVVYDVLK